MIRDMRVQVIEQVCFPRLFLLRHRALLEDRHVLHYILPAYLDPGPDPANETPTPAPARILGCPLYFQGEFMSAVCRDGKVFQEEL